MFSRRTPSLFPSEVFCVTAALLACSFVFVLDCHAKKRRAPVGGRAAIVVDERLSALLDAPNLSATLLRRVGRGRALAIMGAKRARNGVSFYRVGVTRRTSGWMQSDALVSPAQRGDDERLLRLIRGSEEFDRLERARIFLDLFPSSPLRAAVLSLYAEAAEEASGRLSRDAVRRLDAREMKAGGAPVFSYFMSYTGLDRYRRAGVTFIFDAASKRFHYDGAGWREILRRYPRSAEAGEARRRLASLSASGAR